VPGSAIAERFRQVRRDRRDAVAVRTIADGDPITFDDLGEQCDAAARALTDLGVGRGALVLSVVGNHPFFFPFFAACMDCGAALLPVGDATDAEVATLVDNGGAIAIVTDRALKGHVIRERPLGSGMRILRLADRDNPLKYGESVVLKLTSGSTDLPKAAVASELNLINDGRHVIEAMGIEPGDINLGCIPLSHSYAIGNVVMPLLWQGTGVVLRRSFNPAQFVRDVTVTGATVFPGVPFMFERLKALDQLERLPQSLRLLITAGARIGADTVTWFRRRLDRKVHSFYGSSETGGITYDDSDEVSEPLHVGRPVPETTVSVRSQIRGAPAGRILVRGNAVALGYAGGAAEDAVSTFRDGSFLTGDLGYRDQDGRLVLTGRVSALVNVAGRKVDPAEVERTLRDLPGVADAHVFGMSCDRRGQQVVAFVVPADRALTPLAIRQHCACTLSTHKIPRRIVFVDRFPLDRRGKVDRRALQALASDAAADANTASAASRKKLT